MKLLIVEDDKFLYNVLKVRFEEEGIDVQIATNGVDALEVLQDFTPDLILLDLIMPGMDGFEFLRELKADPAKSKIKVIVTSNLGQTEDQKKALDLGADKYIVKSDIDVTELIDIVKKESE